jgi:hypothetical protein
VHDAVKGEASVIVGDGYLVVVAGLALHVERDSYPDDAVSLWGSVHYLAGDGER